MKCPYRFSRYVSERDEECQPDCACLVAIDVKGNYGSERDVLACGLVARGKTVNTIEAPRKEKR